MEKLKHPFVFQVDSDLVLKTFSYDNYIIEYSKTNEKDNFCAIYFSSHNIYYPNNKFNFEKNITKRNKFEWYNTRINVASKNIFLRDLKKQWYLNGINNQIDSVDKIYDFLKKETEGYKTIMIGSSAGGFAAVLLGSKLNSEYILSFNGQFFLSNLLKSSNEETDPIIFRQQNEPAINKYFSIKPFIHSPEKIFYFFSNKSKWDIENYKHINDLGINVISFNTNNHGIPFIKTALHKVINLRFDSLKLIGNKTYNPILFSFKYGSFLSTLRFVTKIFFKKLKL